MSIEQNRSDLERHADDFAERTGFTYTVLDPYDLDVIGCVYVYPAHDGEHDVLVRSWVRASRSELDLPLRWTVAEWLVREWPFERPLYEPLLA
jgi:hypothetical protein